MTYDRNGGCKTKRSIGPWMEWGRLVDFFDRSLLGYATRKKWVADYLAFWSFFFCFNRLVASESENDDRLSAH